MAQKVIEGITLRERHKGVYLFKTKPLEFMIANDSASRAYPEDRRWTLDVYDETEGKREEERHIWQQKFSSLKAAVIFAKSFKSGQ